MYILDGAGVRAVVASPIMAVAIASAKDSVFLSILLWFSEDAAAGVEEGALSLGASAPVAGVLVPRPTGMLPALGVRVLPLDACNQQKEQTCKAW